ncbi:MAG: hypothetical protein ACXVXF_01830 [Mycobacteriaceae bacterium]
MFGPLRQVNHTAPCNQLGGAGAVLSGIEVAATPNAGVGVPGTVLFATVSPTDARGTAAYDGDGTQPSSRGSTLINVTPTPNFFQIMWGLLIAYAHNLHLLGLLPNARGSLWSPA